MGRGKITHQKKIEIKALLEVGLSQRKPHRCQMCHKNVFLMSQKY